MIENLPACPVETALKVLDNNWKFLIIRDLASGTKRFGELKSSVTNISPKVLTNNLRSMEEDGLLVRKIYAEIPPRTEYTLTPLGKSLVSIIKALGKWGMSFKNGGAGSTDFDFENIISEKHADA
jgi:DNA-binding HxlR family transcriptional regulator